MTEYYKGHSKVEAYRRQGSSGGVATTILVDLLRRRKVDYVVVASLGNDNRSEMVITDRIEDVEDAAGSRYTLFRQGDILKRIRAKEGRYAVVAVGCFASAIRKLQEQDPVWKERIPYIIGLYCGNMLRPEADEAAARALGARWKDIVRIAYREGEGEGDFVVETRDRTVRHMPKARWNHLIPFFILEKCVPCRDLFNETADISLGDLVPGWNVVRVNTDVGRSLVSIPDLHLERISEAQALAVHEHALRTKELLRTSLVMRFLRSGAGRFSYRFLPKGPLMGYAERKRRRMRRVIQ
ncbi:Coenzyme F420 hydrogenase/dehydrogenase, beta subunit C-terminal domain [Candidatus Woesearchaeota archaeon]|nr:Coenzyme F420 hydrogenase/dehydrogenase, beta subunit C-terminal domain [Candidatus Woesearchaeota archaeon]